MPWAVTPPFGRRVFPAAALAILVLAYGILFSWLTVLKHLTWHSAVFDLGIFDQVIWNTARGHFFETSIYGIPPNHLGEHFSPILAIFAPLYLVWNDVRVLLIAQSFYMAAGAVPVYLLASRMLGLRVGAVLIAAGFLMYPSLAFVNLFDFHPDTLLVVLLPWAFYFLYMGRDLSFLAMMALTLLVKEDAALIVFAMGLYAAIIAGKRRMGGALAVFALCWFVLAISVFIPYFRGGHAWGHLSRFSYLGSTPAAIALNLVSHPLNTLQILGTSQNLDYLLQLLSPLAFLPILNPAAAMVAAPILLGNLVTDYSPQHTILYQYSIAMGPIFFPASIAAIAHLSPRVQGLFCGRWQFVDVRRTRLFFVAVIFLSGVYGLARDNPIGYYLERGAFAPMANIEFLEKAGELIPPDASLSVSNILGPRFAHRPQISIALEPSDAQYVFVHVGDASLGKLDDLGKIAPPAEYRVLLEQEGIILLQRR